MCCGKFCTKLCVPDSVVKLPQASWFRIVGDIKPTDGLSAYTWFIAKLVKGGGMLSEAGTSGCDKEGRTCHSLPVAEMCRVGKMPALAASLSPVLRAQLYYQTDTCTSQLQFCVIQKSLQLWPHGSFSSQGRKMLNPFQKALYQRMVRSRHLKWQICIIWWDH